MKKLVVLGAGTAGTMVVNKLRPVLSDEWQITIVDQDETHYYQPGFLFIPFGVYDRRDVVKPKKRFIPAGVDLVVSEIDKVDPETATVHLAGGTTLDYDQLVIATGTHPRPDMTPGLDGSQWRKTIHDFYTLDGAVALREAIKDWKGGRMVVSVMELPFKCPVAPLEFNFLADWYFHEQGMRDDVEIIYTTPTSEAFTKPVAAKHLTGVLESKDIAVETDYYPERVDPDRKMLVSYDEREIPYDLLVVIPINMGADFVGRSGLGNELNHVPVDKHTFLSTQYDNIFALGDAADLPTSKAGSVAHFAVEMFTENFPDHVAGRPMTEKFDGHANCFIESGFGKGLLIDFNYDTEPLPGKYPLPGIGPFSLLKETEANHWGKMMFKWTYWNMLLPGRELPLEAHMSLAGKIREEVGA
ncbi:MAG: NAD(P)/FAD-dependent oxidoreductase [Acidimicrobiia bacterium]|nr:NAD(P)/FAD-dependent oxidoreductase [Acidimicrobiia bacterium]